jgi:RNA polymerase sigma-54 factor
VEPDVYFRKVDDQWQAFMNEDDVPQLRLSPVYRRLLARDAADRDVRNYVKERFTAAIAVDEKHRAAQAHHPARLPVHHRRQGEFLSHGADHLKPMMIKEVAEEVGVHPSTVSRAVASKYAHTPAGRAGVALFLQRIGERAGGRRHVPADAEAPGARKSMRKKTAAPA